ncbi:hypothetical protein F4778DRAFT_231484 [Xylariomycetidae sp. FL2044]|nr:hypothetical protein F4778DRAFT_231484 [Xylariomycetidae sp. FL2044]
MYLLYENNRDFTPYKFVIIPPFQSAFISVCPTFRGRLVRGNHKNLDGTKHLLGTWAELNWHPGGLTYGDISLLQGNDGAAVIRSLDGSGNIRGFSQDLLAAAPPTARAQKKSGAWCLAQIDGAAGNPDARDWLYKFLDPHQVYLQNDIDPVITSTNGKFEVVFYEGVV